MNSDALYRAAFIVREARGWEAVRKYQSLIRRWLLPALGAYNYRAKWMDCKKVHEKIGKEKSSVRFL